MISAFAIFSAVVLLTETASGHPVKYDQRQDGDLNVRTDVEDVVFVVVPPKDLISAGMGLVAASAADMLRKNYGPIGLERWPLRTASKIGFVPLEKSPYKIDLEKSGFQVKKISHAGDPNRYNFHENKNPSKSFTEAAKEVVTTEAVTEGKPSFTEPPVKSTAVEIVEKPEEVSSTTEKKTVKKDLKTEDQRMEITEDKKVEKIIVELDKLSEEATTKASSSKSDKMTEEPLRVIGEKSKDNLDPDSIFKIEGCGPEAYRDSTGKCVLTNAEGNPK